MRVFLTSVAVVALALAPCAWDSDPREPSAITWLFGGSQPSMDAISGSILQGEFLAREVAEPIFHR